MEAIYLLDFKPTLTLVHAHLSCGLLVSQAVCGLYRAVSLAEVQVHAWGFKDLKHKWKGVNKRLQCSSTSLFKVGLRIHVKQVVLCLCACLRGSVF